MDMTLPAVLWNSFGNDLGRHSSSSVALSKLWELVDGLIAEKIPALERECNPKVRHDNIG